MTVISTYEDVPDKNGSWLGVRCSFHSPYAEENISEAVFRFRPDTVVEVYFGLPKFRVA